MDLVTLIQDGSASLVYLVAVGLLLGSLHGLEPGHSKTMMAAFIVAVQGTPFQALLLGVSAALSHSLIVWVLAVLALVYGDALIGETLEPYFMAGSGLIVLGVGLFMLTRAARSSSASRHHGHDHHHHGHDHHHHNHGHATQSAALHHHEASAELGQVTASPPPMDAHAMAHAREIEERFANGRATNLQTVGFGLVGGLIPCPAAITVLLLCLSIGQFWLGVSMVAAFSIGLAATLVAVGLVAAVGLRYAKSRSARLDRFLAAAPYLSGVLIVLVGGLMIYSGWSHLPGPVAQ